jgi:L-lactate dehydrogenase complex protein LldG
VTTREAFLGAVRARLGGGPPAVPAAAPAGPAPRGDGAPAGPGPDPDRLAGLFAAAAAAAGATVERVAGPGEVADRVAALAGARGFSQVAAWAREALGPAAEAPERLRARGVRVIEDRAAGPDERRAFRRGVAGADAGLTGARAGIAATGSLVLVGGPGRARLVSLLPPVHVAVLAASALVEGLREGAALLGETVAAGGEGPSGVVLVTGPSRTADIELTLTRGVHGPGELHILLVDGA